MGKGGGCIPSKNRLLKNTPEPIPGGQSSGSNASVLSRDGFLKQGIGKKLRIKKGVDQIKDVEGVLYRVPETLETEVLEQMMVPHKDDRIPIISPEELVKADGFLFGFPTRYGFMAAQMKAFFDSTGNLWREQKLAGLPAGFFVSTGTQGGGQETTAWTAITQLAHHGMLYVPIGYTFGDGMFKMDSLRGGSPYGAGVLAGDGTREPTETELALAEHHGKYMAIIVKRLAQPSLLLSHK